MIKIIWHSATRKTLKSFPEELRGKLGYLIYRLQLGEVLSLPQARKMLLVDVGVSELRVKGKDGVYRSFYIRLDKDSIAVFHAFKKKTQKAAKKDIVQGKKNLKEVKEWLKQI